MFNASCFKNVYCQSLTQPLEETCPSTTCFPAECRPLCQRARKNLDVQLWGCIRRVVRVSTGHELVGAMQCHDRASLWPAPPQCPCHRDRQANRFRPHAWRLRSKTVQESKPSAVAEETAEINLVVRYASFILN